MSTCIADKQLPHMRQASSSDLCLLGGDMCVIVLGFLDGRVGRIGGREKVM